MVPLLRFRANTARGTNDFPQPSPGLTQLRPEHPADARGHGGDGTPHPPGLVWVPLSRSAQRLPQMPSAGCSGGLCELLGLGEGGEKLIFSRQPMASVFGPMWQQPVT